MAPARGTTWHVTIPMLAHHLLQPGARSSAVPGLPPLRDDRRRPNNATLIRSISIECLCYFKLGKASAMAWISSSSSCFTIIQFKSASKGHTKAREGGGIRWHSNHVQPGRIVRCAPAGKASIPSSGRSQRRSRRRSRSLPCPRCGSPIPCNGRTSAAPGPSSLPNLRLQHSADTLISVVGRWLRVAVAYGFARFRFKGRTSSTCFPR